MTDETALLVTVPAAEPAVARHRSRLDTSAAVGVPAHVTVLYPFLSADLIDADTPRLNRPGTSKAGSGRDESSR